MSEVAFAKTFLATLDKRAIKLPGDHVSDPRQYPSQSPHVLPKQTHPFPRRGPATTAQQSKSKNITVSLKPMRAGETVTLPDIALDASVHDLKTQYAAKTGLAQEKIKILLNKKPVADLKTLKDLGVEKDVEFSVMLMGGVQTPTTASSPAVEKSEAAATASAAPAVAGDAMDIDAQGGAPHSEKAQAEAEQRSGTPETVAETLRSDEFWEDLSGFLSQRLRDQGEGERLARLFREQASKR